MTEETTPKLYCYVHPDRETLLRCNRCERPICSQCAVLTPTGYRCKNCVRGQQKVFDTAQSTDFIAAAGIAVVLSFLGSLVAGVMGFFTIFIAPIAGVIIAEAVRWAVHRRRSRSLFQTAAGAAALGSLPLLALALLPLLVGGGIGGLLGLIYRGLYTVLVTTSVYYRLGGVEIR
ncbi:MAG: hypothetical protein ABSE06_04445 [Anaerolineaceae bacterium]|jgi:hypothetical protein